ncbi:hypothetical protein SAMN05444955_10413 [Lihuaxuella thermophila]|uniref:Uncharacterized protein n=1 Tax=Lihuaxuella thermophila TaxID=1173111 RepID=A0A1H8CMU2_9BACL|nr:hypothetical protein SAMN05444955_10413 [Lihuaxuella thermophila]
MDEVPLRPSPAEAPNEGRKRITCLSDSEFDPRPKRGAGAASSCILASLKSTETDTDDRPEAQPEKHP